MRGSPCLQVTDFGSLTEHDVIKPFLCHGDICYLPGDQKVRFTVCEFQNIKLYISLQLNALIMSNSFTVQTQQLECNLTVDPMFIRIGKGAVHTLSCSAQAWKQVLLREG